MQCTSKKLQLLKDVVGSTYQIFIIMSATFSGTWATGVTPFWYVLVTGGTGIILQRVASRVDYWQHKIIIKEELTKFSDMNNKKEK